MSANRYRSIPETSDDQANTKWFSDLDAIQVAADLAMRSCLVDRYLRQMQEQDVTFDRNYKINKG